MNQPVQSTATFDVARVRNDFPILSQDVRGKPLTYLDNGATTQKPAAVIDALDSYYRHDNANVHRAVHALSERATVAYEGARDRIQAFLNAERREEIIFTRGTTEAINLVANSFGRRFKAGDEIIITELEHHSNIVPWQLIGETTGALLKVVPVNDNADLDLDDFRAAFNEHTALVAVTHISNALGSEMPVREMAAIAHQHNIPILVDGAQAVAHLPVDVRSLDVDFYAFSGHKLFGPTGIGVLYGRAALLDEMPPWHGGGDMIETVSFDGSTWNELPYKFEAGTPNIAGAIGLGAAIDYLEALGRDAVRAYEATLTRYLYEALDSVLGLRRIGHPVHGGALASFVMDVAHAQDIGTLLDQESIAIRAGHHCAMPAMQRFGVSATARASLACYNTTDDIDRLVAGLEKVRSLFG